MGAIRGERAFVAYNALGYFAPLTTRGTLNGPATSRAIGVSVSSEYSTPVVAGSSEPHRRDSHRRMGRHSPSGQFPSRVAVRPASPFPVRSIDLRTRGGGGDGGNSRTRIGMTAEQWSRRTPQSLT